MLSENEVTSGEALCDLKVVDAHGERLWPLDSTSGLPIHITVPENFAESQNFSAVEDLMVSMLADKISKHFYSYKPSNPEPPDD